MRRQDFSLSFFNVQRCPSVTMSRRLKNHNLVEYIETHNREDLIFRTDPRTNKSIVP